ncbi:MAG TPA: SRPBCC family protein [Acidimicrobiia bacterium]
MRLHETRTINRPLEDVFSFTADFSNAETWDPGVESSNQVGDAPPQVGTEYELMVNFGSNRIPMRYVITALDPRSRVVLEGHGETLSAVDEILFSATDTGTLVDYTADLRFENWIRFVEPLLAPFLRRVVGRRALDGLVEALER